MCGKISNFITTQNDFFYSLLSLYNANIPVCVRLCLASSSERANLLSHPVQVQGKGRSPENDDYNNHQIAKPGFLFETTIAKCTSYNDNHHRCRNANGLNFLFRCLHQYIRWAGDVFPLLAQSGLEETFYSAVNNDTFLLLLLYQKCFEILSVFCS